MLKSNYEKSQLSVKKNLEEDTVFLYLDSTT